MKVPKRPKKPRAKRIDAGQQKHSTVARLLGLDLESDVDQMLKEDRGRDIQVDVHMMESSAQEETDTDDVKEIKVIWKKVESSE